MVLLTWATGIWGQQVQKLPLPNREIRTDTVTLAFVEYQDYMSVDFGRPCWLLGMDHPKVGTQGLYDVMELAAQQKLLHQVKGEGWVLASGMAGKKFKIRYQVLSHKEIFLGEDHCCNEYCLDYGGTYLVGLRRIK